MLFGDDDKIFQEPSVTNEKWYSGLNCSFAIHSYAFIKISL